MKNKNLAFTVALTCGVFPRSCAITYDKAQECAHKLALISEDMKRKNADSLRSPAQQAEWNKKLTNIIQEAQLRKQKDQMLYVFLAVVWFAVMAYILIKK